MGEAGLGGLTCLGLSQTCQQPQGPTGWQNRQGAASLQAQVVPQGHRPGEVNKAKGAAGAGRGAGAAAAGWGGAEGTEAARSQYLMTEWASPWRTAKVTAMRANEASCGAAQETSAFILPS